MSEPTSALDATVSLDGAVRDYLLVWGIMESFKVLKLALPILGYSRNSEPYHAPC